MGSREKGTGGGVAEPPGLHTVEEDLKQYRELSSRIKNKRSVIALLLVQREIPYNAKSPGGAPAKEK